MTGDEDLNRKGDHLTKHAALCLVETGIEVDTDENGCVLIDVFNEDPVLSAVRILSVFEARLMADALLEAAALAERRNPMNEPPQGSV
jgi:hypothetical protein